MADKEAIVFVIDVGASMARVRAPRTESDLSYALRYVYARLGDMAASGRKTLCAGVVAFRSAATDNPMASEEGYGNIAVLLPLGPVGLEKLQKLKGDFAKEGSERGDAVSAVVVAVDAIEGFTKKQKWTRRVCLVTDGEGAMDFEDEVEIVKKMNGSGIAMNVLGVDFDDAEFGVHEEAKSVRKRENEEKLKQFVGRLKEGEFATLAEAVDGLDVPRAKVTRPYKSYDGPLTLGDGVVIQVERYFKTHRAAPASATSVVVKGGEGGEGGEDEGESVPPEKDGEFAPVKQSRSYKVVDPTAPGGQRDVDFEALAKGYEYGRTAVHISESEHNITKLETAKAFELVGFVQRDKVGLVGVVFLF